MIHFLAESGLPIIVSQDQETVLFFSHQLKARQKKDAPGVFVTKKLAKSTKKCSQNLPILLLFSDTKNFEKKISKVFFKKKRPRKEFSIF